VRLAIACGADAVEIDVRATRDGVPVVLHDAALDRTTDATGPLSAYSYKELRERVRLQGGQGEHVPSLEEVLGATTGRLPLAIENKEPDVTRAPLREIERANASSWVTVWSFHRSAIREVRERAPGLVTGFLHRRQREHVSCWTALEFLHEALNLDVTGVSFFPEEVSVETVAEAHSRGLAVYSGTVDGGEMTHRFAELGLEGLITDNPLACFAALTRREEQALFA
jgi:glycerophosphoryl diester phosphodiesterase